MRSPRTPTSFQRSKPKLRLRSRVLLACEGESEVGYFQDLGLDWRISIIPIRRACGLTPLKLVEEAYAAGESDTDCDAVFCVIDRDTHHCFQNALKFAKDRPSVRGKPFSVFPSLPCFEYWVLLHYGLTTAGFESCDAVWKRVRAHVSGYQKPMPGLYSALLPRLPDARTYAKRAREFVKNAGGLSPMTNLDELLDALEAFRS